MTATAQEQERREHIRREGVYAEYAIVEDYDQSHEAVFKPCFLRNFSLGGSSIFIFEKLPEQIIVILRLYDPNSPRPIEVKGLVAWSCRKEDSPEDGKERNNIGLKFFNISEDCKRRLRLMDNYFELMQQKPHSLLED